MNIGDCPACGSKRLGLVAHPEVVAFKGTPVQVPAMLRTVCAACGYSFASPLQHDANVAAARDAHVSRGAEAKRAKGLLTGAELRVVRERMGLTQREASELFGGGPVAFSKYENEDVMQSAALDKLVRVVDRLGAPAMAVLRSTTGTVHDIGMADRASSRSRPGAAPLLVGGKSISSRSATTLVKKRRKKS